jgi:hypothetical protein
MSGTDGSTRTTDQPCFIVAVLTESPTAGDSVFCSYVGEVPATPSRRQALSLGGTYLMPFPRRGQRRTVLLLTATLPA